MLFGGFFLRRLLECCCCFWILGFWFFERYGILFMYLFFFVYMIKISGELNLFFGISVGYLDFLVLSKYINKIDWYISN